MTEATEAERSTFGIVLAALFGAPITAFVIGSGLVAFFPAAQDTALALGANVIVPFWVLLACTLPLASTAKRAFQICGAITLPIAAALVVRAMS
jgi:hypothetical protein